MAIEVADRLFVSDKQNNRDFIVSNVPSQAVPINITAHDKMHKAVIASIVVESGAIAGPQEEEPFLTQGARDVLARVRQRAVAQHEEVLLAAARAEQEAAALNAQMAERRRAEEEEARARRLAEEEEARAEDRCREDELAAERRRAAILDEENRIEAVRRSLALINEQKQQELARQAMQQGVQQQPLLHSRADAHMTMMPQENVQHEPEQRAGDGGGGGRGGGGDGGGAPDGGVDQ